MEKKEKRFFLNPVKHSEMIKYNLVYGLSADATRELLKQEKDSLVHYRGFLSGIFDNIPMAESEYTRKNGKGRKSNPIADHMVHYWNADTWKNQIYSLYLYGVMHRDPENEIIEAYCRNLQEPKWTASKEFDYPEDAKAKEMLENFGILRRNDIKKKILVRKEFSVPEDYLDSLKEMLCFFNSFAPLSSLGFSILQRLSGNTIKIPFFVKGQSPFRTLRQENVYRCLLAITNDLFIECEDKHLVQPVDLEFDDHFLYEKNCNVYVYVTDDEGKYTRCSVPDNIVLKLVQSKVKGTDSNKKANCRERSSKSENEYRIYRITLLVNTITRDYLMEKACRIWQPELIETDDKDVDRKIPYYPQDSNWKMMTLKYQVCLREDEEFYRYINSFGDFLYSCYVEKQNEKKVSDTIRFADDKRKPFPYQYSLCTPYNSVEFFHRCKKLNLPLTNMELYWLDFIMRKYPNFCRIFLGDKFMDVFDILQVYIAEMEADIAEMDKEDVSKNDTYKNVFWKNKETGESWFDQKVRDLDGEKKAKAYRTIYMGIKQNCYFTNNGVIPYAFQFDVDAWLTGNKKRESFDILAYHMKEKRMVMIKYHKFIRRNSIPADQYPFSEADMWYHLIAYGVRTNQKMFHQFQLSELREELIQNDSKEERLKKLGEVFCEKFVGCESFFQKVEGGESLKLDAFQKIYNAVSEQQNIDELKYQNIDQLKINGVELFCEEELLYKIRVLNTIQGIMNFRGSKWSWMRKLLRKVNESCKSGGEEQIRKITYQILLNMIMGNVQMVQELMEEIALNHAYITRYFEKIKINEKKIKMLRKLIMSFKEELPRMNEFSYTNSILKKNRIEFRLKGEAARGNLEKIYEYFRGFNCRGSKKGDKIVFEVEYERFHYRRIHEILLALGDIVEIDSPPEVVSIIKERQRFNEDKIVQSLGN